MKEAVVKICGLQTLDTVQGLRNLPIDFVGFLFAESKRRVTPLQAGLLIAELHKLRASTDFTISHAIANSGTIDGNKQKYYQAVGVFVNPSIEELDSVLEEAPLDVIQLHGQESPSFCDEVKRRYGLPVIKFFPISSTASEECIANSKSQSVRVQLDPYAPHVDGILLDTYDPHVTGGNGKTFSWHRISEYQDWARQHQKQLLVAGGLHADNVAGLLAEFQPDGVDVSSGVETEGHKDLDKISQFVQRAKKTKKE